MVREAQITAFYFIQSATTGFTVRAFLSRNRVSPKEAFEGLELCEGKLSCTVLRGLDGSDPSGYSVIRNNRLSGCRWHGCLNVVGISARNHVVDLERIESLADRQFQGRECGVGALGKGLAEPDQGVRQLIECCQGIAEHGAEI